MHHSSSYDRLFSAACWPSFYLIADPDDDDDDDDDQNYDEDDDGGAEAGPAFT